MYNLNKKVRVLHYKLSQNIMILLDKKEKEIYFRHKIGDIKITQL